MDEPAHLTSAQTAALRQVLLAEREVAAGPLASLTAACDGIVAAAADVATDDEHDPEGATIAFERAQVAAVQAQVQRHLADLDRALEQLAGGTYGSCETCGSAIAPERLAVRPAARRCLPCAATQR